MQRGDSLNQGKKRMGWKVYEVMCRLFLEGDDPEYSFAHCFLTLEWNLMLRSENVVDCHAENIVWNDDSLGFTFPKSKTDQTGKNADSIWHVYATPHNPITCPILALARYLFSNPGILTPVPSHDEYNATVETSLIDPSLADSHISQNGYTKLFPGRNQYDRFMKCFRKVILENEDEFRRYGIEDGDLGSHSARKGSASYASSGSTVSPPIVSVCLRAQWSMGSVKERYLHYEKAGDQYLGRVVSGLNCSRYLFAASPPYFDFDGAAGNAMTARELDVMMTSFIPRGSRLNSRIFCIFRFCFASLCFHSDFLKQILHKKNKLHGSPFFTRIPRAVRDLARVRFPWNATESTPAFTGKRTHLCCLFTK